MGKPGARLGDSEAFLSEGKHRKFGRANLSVLTDTRRSWTQRTRGKTKRERTFRMGKNRGGAGEGICQINPHLWVRVVYCGGGGATGNEP